MITRISQFDWVVRYDYMEQRVIGTRRDAEETERALRAVLRREVSRLPWFARGLARLQLKLLDHVSA